MSTGGENDEEGEDEEEKVQDVIALASPSLWNRFPRLWLEHAEHGGEDGPQLSAAGAAGTPQQDATDKFHHPEVHLPPLCQVSVEEAEAGE